MVEGGEEAAEGGEIETFGGEAGGAVGDGGVDGDGGMVAVAGQVGGGDKVGGMGWGVGSWGLGVRRLCCTFLNLNLCLNLTIGQVGGVLVHAEGGGEAEVDEGQGV